VLKSTLAAPVEVDTSPLVVNEVTLVGSRCGPFERALQALRASEVGVLPLVEARYPLEDGLEAMKRAAGGALKVLIDV
jgi:threonine dehydrogenase-like Zn-dependent dehydrogenase